MNQYVINGLCRQDHQEFLKTLETVINNQGFIVAFNKSDENSMSVLLEFTEINIEPLLFKIEKIVNMNNTFLNENNPEKNCYVLFNLQFLN